MSNFSIDFQVQGTGAITLPVTALDELIVKVAGLVTSTFRFSVENTLPRDVSFSVTAVGSGSASPKITLSVDKPVLAIPEGQSAVVTIQITPTVEVLESESLDVVVTGVEAA